MIREELLSALTLVVPALAPEDEKVVPAFNNFCFTKKHVLAYDDVLGVRTINPDPSVVGVVPGRLFFRFLKSCTGKNVDINEKQVKCGPTKLNVGWDVVAHYPFKFPKPEKFPFSIALEADFFTALELCSSITPDLGMTAWEGGVSLDFDDVLAMCGSNIGHNCLHFCYLDNYRSKSGENVILPTRFCKAMLSLRKMFDEEPCTLFLSDTSAMVSFGSDEDEKAAAFTRLITPDVKASPVQKSRELLDGLKGFVPLQENLQLALRRMAQMAGKGDMCDVKIEDNGMSLKMKLPAGVIRDGLTLKKKHPDAQARFDPTNVVSQLDVCTEFLVTERFTCFRGENFSKLIAHRM